MNYMNKRNFPSYEVNEYFYVAGSECLEEKLKSLKMLHGNNCEYELNEEKGTISIYEKKRSVFN